MTVDVRHGPHCEVLNEVYERLMRRKTRCEA